MGMFDTVYAELDCPFCGKSYRHTPLSYAQAARDIKEHKQHQVDSRQKFLQGEDQILYMQDFWAEQNGFENVEAWLEQLDSPQNIETYRMRRHLGLAEIQTKEFENALEEFYIGDEVPKYSGHYYIPESFKCGGCSTPEESVYVAVWLEIENRKLKAVLTHDPDIGEPSREFFKHTPFEARPSDAHPPLHFKHRGLQAHARYNSETEQYDMEVHHLPEHFCFSHSSEALLREIFQDFANDYLFLLGKAPEDHPSLHEHLHTLCHHLPSDFEPYGKREREGPDCSCGCKHFLKLPGKLGMDWGVCIQPASPRAGLLTFEHQGCEQFEDQPASEK